MSKIPIPKGGKKFQIPIPIPTKKYFSDAGSDSDSDLNQNWLTLIAVFSCFLSRSE